MYNLTISNNNYTKWSQDSRSRSLCSWTRGRHFRQDSWYK